MRMTQKCRRQIVRYPARPRLLRTEQKRQWPISNNGKSKRPRSEIPTTTLRRDHVGPHPFGASCAARLHQKVRLQPGSQSDRNSVLLSRTVLGFYRDGVISIDALPHGRSEEHTSELQSRQYLVC